MSYHPVSEAMIKELARTKRKFGRLNSAHEGYAVLLEEMDELWDALKQNDLANAELEAIQVGAIAMKLVLHLQDRRDNEAVHQANQGRGVDIRSGYSVGPGAGDVRNRGDYGN